MEEGTLQMEYPTSTYHEIPMILKSPGSIFVRQLIDVEGDTTIGGVIKSGPRRARLPHRRGDIRTHRARRSGRG
jgi:hypothetical protein